MSEKTHKRKSPYGLYDQMGDGRNRFKLHNIRYADYFWKHAGSEKLRAVAARGGTLLDAFCGDGSLTLQFLSDFAGGQIVGWDGNANAIADAQQAAVQLNLNAKYHHKIYKAGEALPSFGRVDAIMASYGIVHNPSTSLLEGLWAQLKSGGTFVIREIVGEAELRYGIKSESYRKLVSQSLDIITASGGNLNVVDEVIMPWLYNKEAELEGFKYDLFYEHYPMLGPADQDNIVFTAVMEGMKSAAPRIGGDYLQQVEAVKNELLAANTYIGAQKTITIVMVKP